MLIKKNTDQYNAHIIQTEWRSALMGDKIKLIQRAEKLGTTFAHVYKSVDELKELIETFIDRELKVSFLKGFEASFKAAGAANEETKTFLHYEILRNKRA
jgi:hypothetical protein